MVQFEHSDFTNSREFIDKLNELSGVTPNSSKRVFIYSGTKDAYDNITPDTTYQVVKDNYDAGMLIVFKLSEDGGYKYFYLYNYSSTGTFTFKSLQYITEDGVSYIDKVTHTNSYCSFSTENTTNEIYLTYEELAYKITNTSLIPNYYYIITDFVTITKSDPSYMSAGHPFMLKVQAASKNSLYPEARALRSDDDEGYFQYCDLSKWKIWYDVNNDTTKYDWINSYCKGVIYRMIDEHNNDCPYDFKNIIFKRYEATVIISGNSALHGYYYWNSSVSNMPSSLNIDNTKYKYVYTFSCENEDGDYDDDTVLHLNSSQQEYRIKNNVIKYESQIELPNIVLAMPYYPDVQHTSDMLMQYNTFYDHTTNITCIGYMIRNDFINCNNLITEVCDRTKFEEVDNSVLLQVIYSKIINGNKITSYSINKVDMINSRIQNSNICALYECIFNNSELNQCEITLTDLGEYVSNLEFKGYFSSNVFSLNDYISNNNPTIVSKDSNGNIKIFNIADLVL